MNTSWTDRKLNVLIACEESQAICKEFRSLGHNCYSCDLLDCSGGHPEWHIKGDALALINGNCSFTTCDGQTYHQSGKWDLLIAHPPCTYLTVSGNRWFDVAKYGNKAVQRAKDREDAVKFFMSFINADCDHIAVENPVGIMSTRYRKPDDIIQPYHFGDSYSKTTCLWTKDLPKLKHTNCVAPKVEYREWTDKNGKKKRQDKTFFECWSKKDRQRLRSKTFPGIAKAIATQYSAYLLTTNQVQ